MRHGTWASELLQAVAGDRGRPALEVGALRVEEGTIAASVDGCDVSLAAEPVSRRVWAAMWRFARGNAPLEAAARGREQSEHLEHLMHEDWDAPLVPARIRLSCSCDGTAGCAHLVALAHAIADEIDRDPSVLLRWRGCTPERAELSPADEPEDESVPVPAEGWLATGDLPAPRPLRPLPAGAVLKRLGPAGVRTGGLDLAEVLQRAYVALAPVDESSQVAPETDDDGPDAA